MRTFRPTITPDMTLTEKWSRVREEAWRWTAHRLPQRLRYWTLIDCGAQAIRGNEIVPDVTFTEVLERTPDGTREGRERQARKELREVVDALRTTHEYVGLDMLPAVRGWSWYDALSNHAPEYIASLSKPPPTPGGDEMPVFPGNPEQP